MNHLVSDFIIRIKNAATAKRRTVLLPYSSMNKGIGKILVQEGFLTDIEEELHENKKILRAIIRYHKRSPVLTSVYLVSKPSLRVYVKTGITEDVRRKGIKTAVLSTSKGVMTGREAKEKGVGGELLFEIS